MAEAIVFLTEEEIVALHDSALEQFGGLPGVRLGADVSSLADYALRKAHYEHLDFMPHLAGCYAFAAAKFHIFNDGNKRVAAAMMEVFLLKNGMELVADDDETYLVLNDLAASAIGEEDIARWVEDNSVLL
jgi:death-on-curing protein